MYSRKKHNISFTKPAEPAFITRMKQQAGYIEGPSVETKKEKLPKLEDADCEDRDDEKPTVVVMNEGDMTQEEVEMHEELRKQAEKEAEERKKKADLSQRVIFKRKKTTTESEEKSSTHSENPKEVKKKKKSKSSKPVISFDQEEEEEQE